MNRYRQLTSGERMRSPRSENKDATKLRSLEHWADKISREVRPKRVGRVYEVYVVAATMVHRIANPHSGKPQAHRQPTIAGANSACMHPKQRRKRYGS